MFLTFTWKTSFFFFEFEIEPRASSMQGKCFEFPAPFSILLELSIRKDQKKNLLLKDQLSKDSRSIKRASGTLIHSDSTASCPSVTEGDSCHREIAPSILHRPLDSERGLYQVRPALLLVPCPSLSQSTAFPCPPLQRNIDFFFFFRI